MTEAYKRRLVALAKELIAMDKPFVVEGGKKEADFAFGVLSTQYKSKVDHLLGYILALEGEEAISKERGADINLFQGKYCCENGSFGDSHRCRKQNEKPPEYWWKKHCLGMRGLLPKEHDDLDEGDFDRLLKEANDVEKPCKPSKKFTTELPTS